MKRVPRAAGRILVADDEPYNLEWAFEYLRAKGYAITTATSVDDALAELAKTRFRALIVDLSIPLNDRALASNEPLAQRYPGLVLADYARNHGHLGRQVIIYSVHDDPLVRAYTQKIGCTYMLKGRPRQWKDELDDVLKFDPLGSREGSS